MSISLIFTPPVQVLRPYLCHASRILWTASVHPAENHIPDRSVCLGPWHEGAGRIDQRQGVRYRFVIFFGSLLHHYWITP